MMRHFQDDHSKAAAYAAMKELERMLKEDGELPPGFTADLSGVAVEINIPQGTTISRDLGFNKDGRIEKKATQNLYGWAVLSECFHFASLFKQHKKLESILIKIVKRAIKRSVTSEEAFKTLMPERAEAMAKFKESLPVPTRSEPTPRSITRTTKAFAIINVFKAKRKAA